MDENTLFKVINDQTEDMVYYYAELAIMRSLGGGALLSLLLG